MIWTPTIWKPSRFITSFVLIVAFSLGVLLYFGDNSSEEEFSDDPVVENLNNDETSPM